MSDNATIPWLARGGGNCLTAAVLFFFGIFQLFTGAGGIVIHYGYVAAIASVVVALWFRFTVPVVIGSFWFARDYWEWHWAFALAFALPGLIFIVIPDHLRPNRKQFWQKICERFRKASH